MTTKLCGCGRPLHYSVKENEARIERVIARHGEFVTVRTREGAWQVPRHFIALHGLRAREIPALAERYGFERVG